MYPPFVSSKSSSSKLAAVPSSSESESNDEDVVEPLDDMDAALTPSTNEKSPNIACEYAAKLDDNVGSIDEEEEEEDSEADVFPRALFFCVRWR